jgi:hypothetical protein
MNRTALLKRISGLETRAVRKANKNADGDPEIALRMVKLYTDTITLTLGNIGESTGAIQRILKKLRQPKSALKLYKEKKGKQLLESLERRMAQEAGRLESLEVEFKNLPGAK